MDAKLGPIALGDRDVVECHERLAGFFMLHSPVCLVSPTAANAMRAPRSIRGVCHNVLPTLRLMVLAVSSLLHVPADLHLPRSRQSCLPDRHHPVFPHHDSSPPRLGALVEGSHVLHAVVVSMSNSFTMDGRNHRLRGKIWNIFVQVENARSLLKFNLRLPPIT